MRIQTLAVVFVVNVFVVVVFIVVFFVVFVVVVFVFVIVVFVVSTMSNTQPVLLGSAIRATTSFLTSGGKKHREVICEMPKRKRFIPGKVFPN